MHLLQIRSQPLPGSNQVIRALRRNGTTYGCLHRRAASVKFVSRRGRTDLRTPIPECNSMIFTTAGTTVESIGRLA